MKGASFEQIKNRMVKKASAIWGVSANEIETSFDPIITLLISACASEILKIEAQLDESQNRVTEKLIQLMTPETVVGSSPAHAILHANTIDPEVTVTPEYQFYFKKRVVEKGTTQKIENVFFSPVQNFKLIQANIKYLATGNSFFELDNAKEKQSISAGEAKANLPSSTMYLGIETALTKLDLQDVSVYFEIDDIDNKTLFFHYLKYAQWSTTNANVNATTGFYNHAKERLNNIQSVFKNHSSKTHLINKQTLNYYKNQFITLNGNLTNASIFPELQDYILSQNIDVSKNIMWIKVVFPNVVNNAVLQNVFCSLNAVPVLNRELNSFTYQMREFINVIPINTSNYFLDIKSIENTNGKAYIPKQKDVRSTGKGTYTIRDTNVGKLDHRSAKDYLTHLIELLKDESASFSFLNNDFLHANLKQLNQLISLLEKKVNGSATNLTEINYITLEPYSKKENLLVEYWTTNGSAANNIKSGSQIEVYKAIGVKQQGNYLLTTLVNGNNNLNMEQRLNAYRHSLLSRGRIVTKEDIKALCYTIYNDRLENVTINKGYTNNMGLTKGITQCIEITLYPNKKIPYDANEWRSLNSNLLLSLENKSLNIFPYKIKTVN